MTDNTADSVGAALPNPAGSIRTDTCGSPLSSCTGAAHPGDVVGVAPVAGAKASVCDHRVAVSFGRHNQDVHPTAETLTLEELDARFNVLDTSRGKLMSAKYHALDKHDQAQKAQRGREKNGEYFVPAHFGGDGRRVAENIVKLSAFVLDFDSGRTGRDTIDTRLEGICYLAYSSYSHRPDDPRWRVLVPYAIPIERSQHEAVFEHFNTLFDDDLDENCKKPGQIYYTPACPADARHEYEQWFADGALFDPTEILERAAAKDGAARGEDTTREDAGTNASLDRLADALIHLDPDGRDLWINVGMALKHDCGDDGLPVWLTWSRRSSKFETEDAQETWASLKPKTGEGAITSATVFHWAKQAGWEPAPVEDIPVEIAELNTRYFVAPYGRKVLVFRQSLDQIHKTPLTDPIGPADFRLLLANRRIQIGQSSMPLADAWLKHPKRREYAGVAFSPGMDVADWFNLWQGFAVEPKPGAWNLMRKHMLFVICGGDRRRYRYLLNWMAYAVQNPGQPAEVAVVMRGGRGVGKGVFAHKFGSLFGPHFRQVNQPRHLLGNFNGHLESCAVLFVDEGFWAGDKAGEGVLKGLVTEPTLAIERKGLDVISARNCLHILIASNSDWVVPAGPDERRFFVLDVTSEKQQDRAYFTPLFAEMDGDGRAAMLYDLRRRNLRRFDIRSVPPSKALSEQKLQSLNPTEKWWFDKLVAAEFAFGSDPFRTMQPWGRVTTAALQSDYEHALRRIGARRRSTETELGQALRKLLPSKPRRTKLTEGGVQVPHYELPPLPDCRTHFEKMMRLEGKIDWESGEVGD